MQRMVPWGLKPQTVVPNVREKLEDLAKHGQSLYSNIYRRAKVLRSSAFEGMLLKATWPDDEPVPGDILDEVCRQCIEADLLHRLTIKPIPNNVDYQALHTCFQIRPLLERRRSLPHDSTQAVDKAVRERLQNHCQVPLHSALHL